MMAMAAVVMLARMVAMVETTAMMLVRVGHPSSRAFCQGSVVFFPRYIQSMVNTFLKKYNYLSGQARVIISRVYIIDFYKFISSCFRYLERILSILETNIIQCARCPESVGVGNLVNYIKMTAYFICLRMIIFYIIFIENCRNNIYNAV